MEAPLQNPTIPSTNLQLLIPPPPPHTQQIILSILIYFFRNSPGTGRTGVYIAVDKCMRMFEDRRRVDIQSCVHTMRSERAGAVQTKEQYNLIYQVRVLIMLFINRIYYRHPKVISRPLVHLTGVLRYLASDYQFLRKQMMT